MKKIESIKESSDIDPNQETTMNKIHEEISDAYSTGIINNEHYTSLRNEISIIYQEIFKKRIDSLQKSPEGNLNLSVQIDKLKEDIEEAYSEGKITELHYNLLNERISKIISKDGTHIDP